MPADDKPTTRAIPLSKPTQHFLQGVAAGNQVRQAHQDIQFPSPQVRLNLFWFYVGALATGEFGISEEDEFSNFILGATTHAPSGEDDATEVQVAVEVA